MTNKKALVTGASRGIGFEIAKSGEPHKKRCKCCNNRKEKRKRLRPPQKKSDAAILFTMPRSFHPPGR